MIATSIERCDFDASFFGESNARQPKFNLESNGDAR